MGIVYGIKEKANNNIIYVGSTSLKLNERKSRHLTDSFTAKSTSPVYSYIREHCDKDTFDNCFEFVTLLTVETNNRTELRKLEREQMEKYRPKYNKNRSYVSTEEYAIENRERVKDIRDSSAGYREKCKAQNKQFFIDNPDYYKQWVENNRDKKRAATKRYRLKKKLEKNLCMS